MPLTTPPSATPAPKPRPARCRCGLGRRRTPDHRLVVDEDGVIVLPAGLHERDITVADALAATAAHAADLGQKGPP
ncbi:hypothetical protein [Pseudorhodoferax sp. Leaf267]|uniref:hypothetical protein n=1 Tax=Pseudorhodoferax sp. Leaf267 TaxID=1736316 RepID=UPI0012E23A98|nr:hypothetical protein [Pseudorhodoferax sp. Leaf267]